MTTLNSLQLSRVDFIKVDVEGAQVAVLRGAAQTIAKFKPRILAELLVGRDYKEVDEASALLGAMGYVRQQLDNDNYLFTAQSE